VNKTTRGIVACVRQDELLVRPARIDVLDVTLTEPGA
jgi:hypothetical protein